MAGGRGGGRRGAGARTAAAALRGLPAVVGSEVLVCMCVCVFVCSVLLWI